MRHAIVLSTILFLPSLTGGHGEAPPAAAARSVYKNPLDVTVDEKGETARVVLTGPRTVAVVDLKAGRVVKEEPWPADKRMPEAGDVPDYAMIGGWHLTPAVATQEARRNFSGFTNLRAMTASRQYYWTANQWANSKLPATQIGQGWVFMNGISVAVRRYAVLPLLLDEPNQGYADPSALVVLPEETFVYVAAGGADLVLVVDLQREWARSESEMQAHGQSYFDLTLSRRQFVAAKLPTQSNPRRLGLSGDGKTLVVSNYLSDSLTVIDTEQLKVVKHISLGGPEPDAARRGEILFNSAKLTQFGQFTCASCHPNGGADGLNWDLPRDGLGNPKNTKSLLGIKDTAPYGWLGTSATLADRVRGTLRTLHRYEPDEQEISDLVAYLETLAPPPPLNKGGPGGVADIQRGRELFEGKANCVACHPGPTFQDGKSHNVGTGTLEGEDRFDTPSLRGVRLTAPYLHDGRAATLEEIFTKHNAKKQHGAADGLTPAELSDLVAYLKSL
jgi:YVTN family beta-propeller protein